MIEIPVVRLSSQAELPRYAHEGDAGLDLVSIEDVELKPGNRAAVGTGIAVAIPVGHVGLVHPRSGRALNDGLTVANAPGTIDSGYRGEVKVILVNLDRDAPVHIKRGDKIAQLVIQRVETATLEEVGELPSTERGSGGFGSTGS